MVNIEREYTVDVSDLKDSEKVEELGAFLEKRLGVKPLLAKKEIGISLPEDSEVPRKELKAILKRSLHSAGIKEEFRVLSDSATSFKIKKRGS